MFKVVQPVITKLFATEKPSGRSIDFSWLLIRREQRPFLLIPVSAMPARVSLNLYSAQRRRGKIWRSLLPLMLKTPAAAIFQRFHFQADAAADIVRFLSEQSGMPVDQLPAPAIKFGRMESQKSRLVLLVCDQTQRPVKVVKLGLDPEGRAVTQREADLLEKLPANTLGCIRVTDRLSTSNLTGFATAYYPGPSPEDDAGMEILFHSWINPEPAGPIENLDIWRELETEVAREAPAAWQVLRAALAGQAVRSTLYHGDFAPWNVRAINSQNLQAFDWESGSLRGIPGWDWFHFFVQTSILARRNSTERVAAEVEQLLRSPRFETYAAAAGISPIVRPLLLAYLLHHRWVVKPLDGGKETEALHDLLAAHWDFTPLPQIAIAGNHASPHRSVTPGLWADACQQLKSARAQLANVFWEPTLTANFQPSPYEQLRTHWPMALLTVLWIATTAGVHFLYLNHQMLLPIYALPCLLATWKMGRRWGNVVATVAAIIAPVVDAIKNPSPHPLDLICWNSAMRFIMFQMCVFFTDRIHRQKNIFRHLLTSNRQAAHFAENWAVILASGFLFSLIAWGDFLTGPRVNFLTLYLFPAMLITLFLNLRWGTLVALLASLNACADEYLTSYDISFSQVFGWNFAMRFGILFLVILLLDRLRQENVLFATPKPNGGANPASHH